MRAFLSVISIVLVLGHNAGGQRKIIGGALANLGEVKYAVCLYSDGKRCTGSLISLKWVLTAAHCDSEHVTIMYMGSLSCSAEGPGGQMRKTSKMVIHPGYMEGPLAQHDLALAEAEEPFEKSEYVDTLPLSGQGWAIDEETLPAFSYGWGKDEYGSQINHLRVLNTKAKHGEGKCLCVLRYQAKRLICLDIEDNEGICFGDSGGALVVDGKGVGVAHQAKYCSKNPWKTTRISCYEKDTKRFYMYLCPYLNWIKEHVPEVPSTPISCYATKTFSPFSLIISLLLSFFVLSFF